MKKAILPYYFFELKKDDSGMVIDKVYQRNKVSKYFMEWLEKNKAKPIKKP